MIHGRKFTLLTDHKPLVAVFGSKKGVPMYTANRLERWATTLLGYDFTIEYHSTENFGQADALSRLVDKHTAAEEDVVIAAINAEHDVRRCLSDSIHAFPVTSELISRATAEDSILTEVMKCIMDNWAKPPDHYANRWIPATVRRRLGNVVYQLETKHGMWYRHANQIQQRKSSNKLDVKGTPSLLNTFGLDDPTLHAHVEVGNSLEDQEQPEYTQQQDPHPEIRLRRSSRIRQKPLRLDVDPKQKTYRFY
ncbi:hypothetical protein D918_06557 [Trichuris suis]|nr:hypothetical protein D918_06557 [Trichuris suis]